MRIILKIFAIPVMLVLTAVVSCSQSGASYGLMAFGNRLRGGALVGIVLLFTGEYVGGGVYLTLAFLLSPFGLPYHGLHGW